MDENKATGCLLGLGIGDALGGPTEFLPVAEIEQRYGPWRDLPLVGDPALVTDDTQMALCVARALTTAPLEPGPLTAALRREFVAWSVSPDNDRAPGTTCLAACRGLAADDRPWQQASMLDSKGCGATMRAQPVGLARLDDTERAAVSHLQAALTHGHPTALAAAHLTAEAVHLLATGLALSDLLPALHDCAHRHRSTWHGDWLGTLWPGVDPGAHLARGYDECRTALDLVAAGLALGPDADPCAVTGEGWVAEQALATGLLCALLLPGDPAAAVRRAAVSSGDSDSIASMTGSLLGAWLGPDSWQADWVVRLEHSTELQHLGRALAR